ncbi:MAG: RND family transporter [Geminicoccaceae bacterium]
MSAAVVGRLSGWLFGHRTVVIAAFTVLTALFALSASQLRIDAGFEKHLPLSHPYVATFLDYEQEFGQANRLLIAVRAKDGDMFTPAFFDTLKAVTDEVFFLPGVNRASVTSLFTPNVRFIEVVEGGFAGGNVIPADFAATPDDLAEVRRNIIKADIVGRLVSRDLSAALITASLIERDPQTGGRLDYFEVARQLDSRIRDRYQSETIDIHILGFAKVLGDIREGARGVLAFFAIAFVLSAGLVYAFTHSAKLAALTLGCALIAVVWSHGLLPLLGYGVDPMSILVPFLVFAIGVSHGVQMVNAFGADFHDTGEPLAAARGAFERLVVPGGIALISDTIGFLTLLLIHVPIIRELALAASLGVAAVLLTNLILLPVLLSYVRLDDRHRARHEGAAAVKEHAWALIARCTTAPVALPVLAVAGGLAIWAYGEARHLSIGDAGAGVPELRPDSRYNQDTAVVTALFDIGVDTLSVIVETVPDACIDHAVMREIDRFAWHLRNVEGVQSTLSLAQVARTINAGWNEGHPAWRVLPRNPQTLVQAIKPVDTSTGLLNSDCSVMPVIAFLQDHRAQTLARVVDAVHGFQPELPPERLHLRLATGNAGVMAATNQVVEATQFPVLIGIYAAVFALCLLTFRSLLATLCILTPLALVSLLCYALMSLLGIGLKVTTMPVAALGVGIGVDYGIYIFAGLQARLRAGFGLQDAYRATLRSNGNAVMLTGLTLSLGVATWAFSALQFQADMGLLLAFMFLANMIGALVLLPAVAYALAKLGLRLTPAPDRPA